MLATLSADYDREEAYGQRRSSRSNNNKPNKMLQAVDLMAPLFGSSVHTQPNRIDGEFGAVNRSGGQRQAWIRVQVSSKSSQHQMLTRSPWMVGLAFKNKDKDNKDKTVVFKVDQWTRGSSPDHFWARGSVQPRHPLDALTGCPIYTDKPGCVVVKPLIETSASFLNNNKEKSENEEDKKSNKSSSKKPIKSKQEKTKTKVASVKKAGGGTKRKPASESKAAGEEGSEPSSRPSKRPRRQARGARDGGISGWSQDLTGQLMAQRLLETAGQQRYEYVHLPQSYQLSWVREDNKGAGAEAKDFKQDDRLTVTITKIKGKGKPAKPKHESFALAAKNVVFGSEHRLLEQAINEPDHFWSRAFYLLNAVENEAHKGDDGEGGV